MKGVMKINSYLKIVLGIITCIGLFLVMTFFYIKIVFNFNELLLLDNLIVFCSKHYNFTIPSIYFNPHESGIYTLNFLMRPSIIFYYFFGFLWLFISTRKKNGNWNKIRLESGIDLKLFFYLILVFTMWNSVFFQFNLVKNSYQIIERLIILLFIFLSFKNPRFIYFSLILFYQNESQFAEPFGVSYSLTDKQLPLCLLIIFVSYLLVRDSLIIFKNQLANFFDVKQFNLLILPLILLIVSSGYFIPFIAKVIISPNYIDWPFIETFDIEFLKYNERGWLVNVLDQKKINLVYSFLDDYGGFLLFLAFSIEFLAVLIFFNKKISILLLLSFVFLHLGIFLCSGILFWKWILVDLLLIIILIKKQGKNIINDFRIKSVILVFLILSFFYIPNTHLAWYGTNYSSRYRLFAITEREEIFEIPLNEMEPFDMVFTFSNRWNITKRKIYPSGTTDYKIKKQLEVNLESNQDYKQEHFNKQRVDKFINSLKLYFNNYNRASDKQKKFPYIPTTPDHIYLGVKNKTKFSFNKKVKKIIVKMNTCKYKDSKDIKCSEFEILKINIY